MPREPWRIEHKCMLYACSTLSEGFRRHTKVADRIGTLCIHPEGCASIGPSTHTHSCQLTNTRFMIHASVHMIAIFTLRKRPTENVYQNPENERLKTLILQRFRARLTLFSKYFASFPQGTCSPSDSRQYLASDQTYDPICASIPGSTTLYG